LRPGQRDPGDDGALSKLSYATRGRELILTETVVANRLPNSFEAYYHHDDMDNTLRTTFTVLSENRTRYEIEGGTPRTGSRLTARLLPGAFTKQAQTWLNNFKVFAEGHRVG
jgi:hypothetical protein